MTTSPESALVAVLAQHWVCCSRLTATTATFTCGFVYVFSDSDDFGHASRAHYAAAILAANPPSDTERQLAAIKALILDLNADANYRVPKRHLGDRLRGVLGDPTEDPGKVGERCRQCGPGYRIGDDGCRHGEAAVLTTANPPQPPTSQPMVEWDYP